GRVPKPDGFVLAAGQDESAAGTERQVVHSPLMPGQAQDWPSAGHVPDLRRGVCPAEDDGPAIRAEGRSEGNVGLQQRRTKRFTRAGIPEAGRAGGANCDKKWRVRTKGGIKDGAADVAARVMGQVVEPLAGGSIPDLGCP